MNLAIDPKCWNNTDDMYLSKTESNNSKMYESIRIENL